MAKAVIIDDHPIFTEGIIKLLSELSIFEDIQSFPNADNFLKQISPPSTISGDFIILLDINLNRVVTGVDICAEIKSLCPNCKIVALSMHDEYRYINGMLNAGADGYILKSDPIVTIAKGLQSILIGNTFLSESVLKILERSRHERDLILSLSPKEKRVLELALEGKSNKEIGEAMFLNHKTIAYYKNSIFMKYDVKNMKELNHLFRSKNEQ